MDLLRKADFFTIVLEKNQIVSITEPLPNHIYSPSILRILSHSLLRFFQRIQNLYLLFIYLWNFSSAFRYVEIEFLIWAFSLILHVFKDLALAYPYRREALRLDNESVERLDPATAQMTRVRWRDLTVGSMVLLGKKEVSPADILILDTSDLVNKESICFTSLRETTGETEKALRKACRLTQNGKCPSPKSPTRNNAFSRISLQLEVENGHSRSGFLRILNDPKTEKVTSENFIEKGEMISSSWVFGLVVFVGREARIMQDFRRRLYRRSRLERISELYFYVLLILQLILALFGEIMFRTRKLLRTQENEYYNNNMNHLLLYATVFPLDLHFLSEFFFLVLRFRLQRKVRSITMLQNPNLTPNLAHLDYVLLEKTGVLTEFTQAISMVYFKATDSLFKIDPLSNFQAKFTKLKSNTRSAVVVPAGPRSGYLSSKPPMPISLKENCESLPVCYSAHSAELKKSKQFLQEFLSYPSVYIESLVAILSVGASRVQPDSWQLGRKEAKLIDSFGRTLGFEYKRLEKSSFQIRINENDTITMKVLAFHEETGEFRSIVAQPENTEDAWLFSMGKTRSFAQRLDSESRATVEGSIRDKFMRRGFLEQVVFARRTLGPEELIPFQEKYHNLQSSLINQEEYLSELFSGILREMELVALFGFEEVLSPGSEDFIQYLKELNVNLWLLSGDSLDRVYSTAHRLQVFDYQAEGLWLDAGSVDEATGQMKAILNNLSKEIKPIVESVDNMPVRVNRKTSPQFRATRNKELMTIIEERKEKFLLINGRTLDLLFGNEYLFSHFCFVAQIVKNIVGFGISDKAKGRLLRTLKQKFNDKTTVLTIGRGWKDRCWPDLSDVSVQCGGDALPLADFSVREISAVQGMIAEAGDIHEKYINFLEFSHYKSLMFTIGLFVFIFFDEFYSNCLYDPMVTLFFFTVFSIATQGLLLAKYRRIGENLRREFKELYHEARFKVKNKEVIKRFLFLAAEAGLIAGIVSLDCFYNDLEFNSLGLVLGLSIMNFLVVKVDFNRF